MPIIPENVSHKIPFEGKVTVSSPLICPLSTSPAHGLIPELYNSGILVSFNKDKISELCNSEIWFSLKILSYEKLMKN